MLQCYVSKHDPIYGAEYKSSPPTPSVGVTSSIWGLGTNEKSVHGVGPITDGTFPTGTGFGPVVLIAPHDTAGAEHQAYVAVSARGNVAGAPAGYFALVRFESDSTSPEEIPLANGLTSVWPIPTTFGPDGQASCEYVGSIHSRPEYAEYVFASLVYICCKGRTGLADLAATMSVRACLSETPVLQPFK